MPACLLGSMLDEIGCTGAVETIDSTMLLSTYGMYSGISALTHTSHRSGDQAQQRQLPRGINTCFYLSGFGFAIRGGGVTRGYSFNAGGNPRPHCSGDECPRTGVAMAVCAEMVKVVMVLKAIFVVCVALLFVLILILLVLLVK